MARMSANFIRIILTIVLTLALTVGSGLWAKTPRVSGQSIIKMKNGSRINGLIKKFDISVVDSIEEASIYLVEFSKDKSIDSMQNCFGGSPSVDATQSNFFIDIPETFQISQGFPDQNAPSFIFAESPSNFYQQPGTYNTGLDSAAQFATGAGVTVALIDNGLSYDHPILQNMTVVEGFDFIDNDNLPSEVDGLYLGHGTFVASVVWLSAPDCQIMPIRAFNADGQGDIFKLMRAIYWAVNHGADVINLSCGIPEPSSILANAVKNARNHGVVLVTAAGNSADSEPIFPAAYGSTIAVSAVNDQEQLADFSSFGSYVDICAPGVNVYGALVGPSDWGTWSGTSFATPFVTGTVALILQINPDMQPGKVVEHLKASARTDLMWGTIEPPDIEYGYGFLDALSAVISLSTGDLNLSGTRDILDLQLMATEITENPSRPCKSVKDRITDVNCDGLIDNDDLQIMTNYFSGQMCRWHSCFK